MSTEHTDTEFSLPSATVLRNRLEALIKNNNEHSIFEGLTNLDYVHYKNLPSLSLLKFPNKDTRFCFLYRNLLVNNYVTYYYTLLINLASKAAQKKLMRLDPSTWQQIISADIKQVNCLIAAIAWLTVDGVSLRCNSKRYESPDDLYYNLVLEEPLAVFTFVMFLLGDKRDLSLAEMEHTANVTYNRLLHNMPVEQ